jgi:hypothetical protein
MRRPAALKIAFAIAATDGMIGGSLSVFAPNGPNSADASDPLNDDADGG